MHRLFSAFIGVGLLCAAVTLAATFGAFVHPERFAQPPPFPLAGLAYVVAAFVLLLLLAAGGRAARFVSRHVRELALLAIGGAVVLSLAACGTGPASQAGAALSAADSSLVIAKAEYGFETTYNVAANAYLKAVAAGLPASTKAAVKPLVQQAYQLVLDARAAQAIGDAAGVSAKAAAINQLVSQIVAQLPASQ